MQLVEIEARLREPFAFEDIDFLPKGKVERDGKTLCMALPYADPRVYQDRLNTIAYGEWSTPAPVVIAAGNKLICYVTVILCGVPHTDVGEATNNEENTGTEAWAQAFKRACSQFGLGRYLYDLEKEWVPFNPQKKQIDLDKAGKQAIVRKMYQKVGISDASRNGIKSQSSQQGSGDAPATEQQIASIRKLCEHLGEEIVEEQLADMTYQQAKEAIAELSAKYKQMKNQPAPVLRNGDGTPDVPSVKDLQKQCNAIFGVGFWQAMLQKALKAPDVTFQDGDLTVEDRQKAKKFLDWHEQQQKAAKTA